MIAGEILLLERLCLAIALLLVVAEEDTPKNKLLLPLSHTLNFVRIDRAVLRSVKVDRDPMMNFAGFARAVHPLGWEQVWLLVASDNLRSRENGKLHVEKLRTPILSLFGKHNNVQCTCDVFCLPTRMHC